LQALWWPFSRVVATLAMAPILGEALVPVTVRILLSLVLAVVMLPVAQTAAAIDPFSLHGVLTAIEQVAIGGILGLALHLTMSAVMVLGFLVSSQIGLSMAVMNDPMNGASSDVISGLLSVLYIVAFFAIDGHLVLAGVIGASFKAWPVGAGLGALTLQTLALAVAWVFSAALLLAVPIIFSTIVVQIGFGFLNRAAPALNLFSLGFSVVTVFGLLMLLEIVRFLPEQYLRMTTQVLDLLQRLLHSASHG
jgi:flagellar biosynthetic protein FliR